MRPGRDGDTHGGGPPRVCIVGSSSHFLSGISYFTVRLAGALAERVPVSAILMRRLIPRRLYPGRARVGQALSSVQYPATVPVYDGVDWYWLPTIVAAVRFLARQRPTHVVFQWWTGAVLHSFIALAVAARRLDASIVVEFHEVQDTGEARIGPASAYVRAGARLLMSRADGFVIHSEADRAPLERSYRLGQRPVVVIPHGPFDHHDVVGAEPLREAPPGVCNLLFFGTIRPYKGLEDAVVAFERLCDDERDRFWLTVVGETWEGWRTPIDMIAASRHRDRITLVNRYVADSEVDRWFAGADAVVLPYRRSSASGPLHLSMSAGLPTIVTAVGGLPAAARDYGGAVFVDPADIGQLQAAMAEVASMRGQRFEDPHSWRHTTDALLELLEGLAP